MKRASKYTGAVKRNVGITMDAALASQGSFVGQIIIVLWPVGPWVMGGRTADTYRSSMLI
jgi:hypothetical protein